MLEKEARRAKEKRRAKETPSVVRFEIDFERLAQEVLVQLRGDQTQRELSQKLGFSFNQVGKWEAGVTHPKWVDFLRLIEVLKIAPAQSAFKRFFWAFEGDFNVPRTIEAIEKAVLLSAHPEYSDRGLPQRWIKGELSPDLAAVFKAMDTRPAILLGWLSTFLDCSKLSTIAKPYANFAARIESVFQDPNCIYVNAALDLPIYQKLDHHDEALLAEHAACTVPRLRKTLKTLQAFGIIRFDGRKYLPGVFDYSFSGLPSAKLRSFTKYTTELAARRYPTERIFIDPEKTPNISVSSARVAALSSDAAKKVRELVLRFHNEVAEIVEKDHFAKDNVQVILLHSFASNINSQADEGLPS